MSDLSNRTLTDDYVHHLATRLAGRLREGYDLPDALGETLRERAPVRFDLPESESGDTSVMGWILRLGLLAGAGLAANYAAKTFLGQDLVGLVKEQTGGSTGYQVDEKYSAVHGTPGAEMPRTGGTSGAPSPASAGASAFAAPPSGGRTGSPSSGAATSEKPAPAGAPAPQTPPASSATKASSATSSAPSGGTSGGTSSTKNPDADKTLGKGGSPAASKPGASGASEPGASKPGTSKPGGAKQEGGAK